jgi:hypothetical protein
VVAPAWSSHSPSKDKAKLKKCELCGVLQCVRPAGGSLVSGPSDDSVSALVASGSLRACPQCSALQMKDRGMCNVLQCHGCQIWWNWSSRATGKNPAALKEQARRSGTMWEAGELQFQLQLQHEDPEAFRQLLHRNGIEFNPNVRRTRKSTAAAQRSAAQQCNAAGPAPLRRGSDERAHCQFRLHAHARA